jgi:LuxR family maltose regulon positive regulatory protein
MAEPSAMPPSTTAGPERDVLLATKLHEPRTLPGFVVRPRLLERLAEGIGRGLVLVCTPAGFGKTTLLADWARRSRRPVAWLSLDDAENDPARLWRHVATALDMVCPGVAERVAALLGPPPPRSFEELVITLDTVKRHVTHILDKLGVANRVQAVTRARELGLLR